MTGKGSTAAIIIPGHSEHGSCVYDVSSAAQVDRSALVTRPSWVGKYDCVSHEKIQRRV